MPKFLTAGIEESPQSVEMKSNEVKVDEVEAIDYPMMRRWPLLRMLLFLMKARLMWSPISVLGLQVKFQLSWTTIWIHSLL